MAPFLVEVILLATAIKLGALSNSPPCIRSYGLLLEAVVEHSGLARGAGWKQ